MFGNGGTHLVGKPGHGGRSHTVHVLLPTRTYQRWFREACRRPGVPGVSLDLTQVDKNAQRDLRRKKLIHSDGQLTARGLLTRQLLAKGRLDAEVPL